MERGSLTMRTHGNTRVTFWHFFKRLDSIPLNGGQCSDSNSALNMADQRSQFDTWFGDRIEILRFSVILGLHIFNHKTQAFLSEIGRAVLQYDRLIKIEFENQSRIWVGVAEVAVVDWAAKEMAIHEDHLARNETLFGWSSS